ncbi:MAG: PatB family C-S lyase [Bacteroidales bacterium]|nr:PatB family C-S lyase [Bacteroidales bacterium]
MSSLQYDFNKQIHRIGTSSIKYDRRKEVFNTEDVLPMWVADMDFETPDFIRFAIIERAMHPIYGYTFRDDSYYEAMISWLHRRHGWQVQKDWILYTPGVVPALNIAVLAHTDPGDKIIIQPPVYFPFFTAVENHGRSLLINQLLLEDGRYRMNYNELEQQAKEARMLILCNPHNPVGRSWEKEELQQLADICLANDVLILSDEIHNDLVLPPNQHQVLAALSDEVAGITLTAHAASKTFNLAGLASSAMIIPNTSLRQQFEKQLKAMHIEMGNLFGFQATQAAFTHGDEWVDQLLDYVQKNIEFTIEFLKEKLPKLRVIQPEATYMVWLDFNAYGLTDDELAETIIHQAGLGLNRGSMFGPGGSGFMRINLACPMKIVQKALDQLVRAFEAI